MKNKFPALAIQQEEIRVDGYGPANAFLVGGPEGVFAVWHDKSSSPGLLRFAKGDDGSWRLLNMSYHPKWALEMAVAIQLAALSK